MRLCEINISHYIDILNLIIVRAFEIMVIIVSTVFEYVFIRIHTFLLNTLLTMASIAAKNIKHAVFYYLYHTLIQYEVK